MRDRPVYVDAKDLHRLDEFTMAGDTYLVASEPVKVYVGGVLESARVEVQSQTEDFLATLELPFWLPMSVNRLLDEPTPAPRLTSAGYVDETGMHVTTQESWGPDPVAVTRHYDLTE